MIDIVIIIILLVIIGAAINYIRKEKKKGAVCIGCPMAGECAKKHNHRSQNGCSCGNHTNEN